MAPKEFPEEMVCRPRYRNVWQGIRCTYVFREGFSVGKGTPNLGSLKGKGSQ
jgi:hypothetical protein